MKKNMKINNLIAVFFVIIGLSGIKAQENIPVCIIKKGEITITNKIFLNEYFYKKNGESGTLNSYKSLLSPDGSLVYIISKIRGNEKNIRCIGVSLLVKENIAYYVPTGTEGMEDFLNKSSVTNTCESTKCTSCILKVVSWKPFTTMCESDTKNKRNCNCGHSISISTTGFQLEIPAQENK
jgi:hypothetical protein